MQGTPGTRGFIYPCVFQKAINNFVAEFGVIPHLEKTGVFVVKFYIQGEFLKYLKSGTTKEKARRGGLSFFKHFSFNREAFLLHLE